jgi:hypothetical protein
MDIIGLRGATAGARMPFFSAAPREPEASLDLLQHLTPNVFASGRLLPDRWRPASGGHARKYSRLHEERPSLSLNDEMTTTDVSSCTVPQS